MGSIRRRTLLLVLGLLGIALGGISFLGYRDARHEIQELFDARLAQQARLLAGMIPGGMAPDARNALQEALDARRGVFRPLPFIAVRQQHAE